MFIYKYCPKCNKRNHKGNKLATGGKFGKDVFAITLSVVILLFAVTAYASKSYIDHKANKVVQPVTDTKTTEPTQTTLQAPATTTQPTTTPTATTAPTTTTKPVTTPKATSTPAITTAPVTQPTTTPVAPVVACDEGKKYSAIDVETIAYNQYVQYENTRHMNLIQEIAKCWQPGVQGCPDISSDDKLHADNLAGLKTTHEAKVAEINARCY
jgi:hypothetical protein